MSDPRDEDDLLARLAPPEADLERPVGAIDGPPGWEQGFGAGLRVWCGPLVGWRDFGEVALLGVITRYQRHLTVTLAWDLGASLLPRAARLDIDDPQGEPR